MKSTSEPIQCVILAGGLAQRMRPLTECIPKSLLPIGDYPFIHYQLQWLASHGVDEVVLCIGHLGEMIREFVGDGSRWGLRVTFVQEGAELLGTGGALRLAFDKEALREAFLLTYGDSFLPIDFGEVWSVFGRRTAPALMTVFRNSGRWDSSNVCYEDGWVTLYDKHKKDARFEFIDYGLSAMQREIVETHIPSGRKFDLAELFNRLSRSERLAGYEATERFYEIGSREGFLDFTQYVNGEKFDLCNKSGNPLPELDGH